MNWCVYMLWCADRTLYTGVTTDLERRVAEHNTSARGAKYTRTRRPVVLAYEERFGSRSDALRREVELKKLGRPEKLLLLQKKGVSIG